MDKLLAFLQRQPKPHQINIVYYTYIRDND